MSKQQSKDPSARRAVWLSRVSMYGALCLALIVAPATAVAQQTGAQLFAACGACHSIGGGRRVGPDLAGVTQRRSEQWLISFIRSPQAFARSNADAAALLREFSPIVMPDQSLSDAQIRSLIAHLGGGAAPSAPAEPEVPATPADVARGQELFQGTASFENGGPACISCHNVRNDAVIGGGVLARDLTTVFTRMGGGGVRGILGSPPFPVMERAYAGRAFNAGEIRALVGFLQHADAQNQFQRPRDYGVLLVATGTGVFVGLMILYALLWSRRRVRSVNQDIYDRQVRST